MLWYFWVAVSVVVYSVYLIFLCCWYKKDCIKKFCKLRAKQWLWILLGFLLIWFNNPAHVFVVMTPTYFGWIFEMICMTTFIVALLAYLENSFYMLWEEIYKKFCWFKYLKFLFYFSLTVLVAAYNGIGLKQISIQGDFGLNQRKHTG